MDSNSEKVEFFKEYLEKKNVVATLTGVLIKLYNSSSLPENPLEFIRRSLGEPKPKSYEVEILERKVQVLQAQREILQLENMQLQNEMERNISEKTPQHETFIANFSPNKHNNDDSATKASSQMANEVDKLVVNQPPKKDILKAVRDLSLDLTKVEETLSEVNNEHPKDDNKQLEYASCAEIPDNDISQNEIIEKDPLIDSGNLMENSQDLTGNNEDQSDTNNLVNESDLLRQSFGAENVTIDPIDESDLLRETLETENDFNQSENEAPIASESQRQTLEVAGKCDNADSISLLQDTTLPSDSDEESSTNMEVKKSTTDFLEAIEKVKTEVKTDVDSDENQSFSSPSKEKGNESSPFVSPVQSTPISGRSSSTFEDVEESKDECSVSFIDDKSFHSVEEDDEKEVNDAVIESNGKNESLAMNYSDTDAFYGTSEIYDPEFSFLLSKSV